MGYSGLREARISFCIERRGGYRRRGKVPHEVHGGQEQKQEHIKSKLCENARAKEDTKAVMGGGGARENRTICAEKDDNKTR